jgi:hypothetical protein
MLLIEAEAGNFQTNTSPLPCSYGLCNTNEMRIPSVYDSQFYGIYSRKALILSQGRIPGKTCA